MKDWKGLLLAALLLPGAAAATGDQVIVNTDAVAIVAQQRDIRSQVLAGEGRYADLSEADRRRLFSEQDKVLGLLEGKTRSTELSQINQTILFNSLESIWAIVNQAEDERIVCERIRAIGSNRTQRFCMTVAERRERASQARSKYEAVQSNTYKCDDSGCPGHGEVDGW